MTKKQRTAALNHANRVRAHFGLKPRTKLSRGIREDCYQCPIAATIVAGTRTMSADVGTLATYADRGKGESIIFQHNKTVTSFINRFDNDGTPDLLHPDDPNPPKDNS